MDYEEEMRANVNRWIESRGLESFNEFRICWRRPDVIGVDGSSVELAVEMKLSDWKEALNQARVYTMFARECYVAMPYAKSRVLLMNLREFNRSGIGILLVAGDGQCHELLGSHEFPAPFHRL